MRFAAITLAVLFLSACDGGPDVVQSTTAGAQSAPPPASSGITISGQPSTSVAAESNYSFTPTTNASGANVSFEIRGTPPWATFNNLTGTLAGTPSASNVGTYEGIVISVSDGSSSASLAPFSIQVTGSAHPSGSVTLAWDPPTMNVDGTPLTNLVGYRIYYGTDAGALDQSVPVTDSTLSSFSVQGLAAGTWYFAIQAITAVGSESALSNVASATIS